MKNNTKIIIVSTIVLILFSGFFVYNQKSKKIPLAINNPQVVKEEPIIGTYVATLAKEVYTLTVYSQQNESFEGKLDIKNFEKDSSTGTLKGTYINGILLADYTFMSEGVSSLGQVVFKKIGNDFVRGYGKPDDATGTRFVDLSKIAYDTSVIYKKVKDENINNTSNPASSYCLKVGGSLVINKRGDGGEYGLCYFEDNRACEEWALMRGECPIGGRKTTGYDTIDQNYCAWSGGQTFAVPNSVCTFKNGSNCSTLDFYNGKCSVGKSIKNPVVCPMIAKLCPDGSSVGPTGPNCELICP